MTQILSQKIVLHYQMIKYHNLKHLTCRFWSVWGSADIPTPRLFFALTLDPWEAESLRFDDEDFADNGGCPAECSNITLYVFTPKSYKLKTECLRFQSLTLPVQQYLPEAVESCRLNKILYLSSFILNSLFSFSNSYIFPLCKRIKMNY